MEKGENSCLSPLECSLAESFVMSKQERKLGNAKDTVRVSEIRQSWSWRRREGLMESEGEIIDMDTLEVRCDSEETDDNDEAMGLSSQEALKRLLNALSDELAIFKEVNHCTWRQDLWNTLGQNRHLPMSFISLTFLILEFLVLVLSYGLAGSERSSSLPLVEGIIVLMLTAVNLALCVREERLRRTEMVRSVKDQLSNQDVCWSWMPSDYVDPGTPPCPSISLVHAFRDKELVSVPCNLLVHGDVVVLGPGHSAPAQVRQLFMEPPNSGSLLVLEQGEVFYPSVPQNTSTDTGTKATGTEASHPHPREKFLVMETPFQLSLRKILNDSLKRPVSILGNEMNYIINHLIEKGLIPVILVLSLTVNILRLVLLQNDSGHWSEMLLSLQGYVVLPLLPISFPVIWICLYLYGAARIELLFTALKENEEKADDVGLRQVLSCFWQHLRGEPSSLPRTANLLEILGSVTVWCCVDKEGILSLPNPCAEKVFFLKSRKQKLKEELGGRKKERKESEGTWTSDASKVSSSQDGQESSEDEEEDTEVDDDDEVCIDSAGENWKNYLKGHKEVLSLSSDPESQFGIRFDDVRWQNHINSLKPLGLNILLNSCCKSPVQSLRFADHTGLLSLSYNPLALPCYRRCLCLLGKEMGFMERALQLFTKQQYIFAVQSPVNSTFRYSFHSHSFLSISKEKPIPNMVCLVAKEERTGALQLLTQGSADVVLDACSDYWDGTCICPITAFERKRVLEFYQRHSTSASCVAFAYRPVTEIPEENHRDVYLELPSTKEWRPSEADDIESSSEFSEEETEDKINVTNIFNLIELPTDVAVTSLLDKVDVVENVEGYQRILGGQIFIGMVALQFQAKKDVLPLVEDLNNAGIRFVYFSSENELRSRAFAERMGLETGWNCHISLREGGGQLFDDRGSSATISEKNAESLFDTQDDINGATEHDGEERHVSWWGVEIDGSPEKESIKPEGTESDSLLENQSEGGALLGSSQMSAPEDYWFFTNRAKLPRGIPNIRPHLDGVDNVPLLVPLFTDCSPSAVQEMISIMQDYGEVVCCVGSSFNCANAAIFLQADIGIAVEPLFPQLCLKGLPKDFRSGTPQLGNTRNKLCRQFSDEHSHEDDNELSPLELSAFLNALPCSLAFHRDTSFQFKDLIKEARRICFGLRNCFSFMLSCQLVLSLVMLLSSCVLLPPPLTGLHLVFLSCLTVPLLSLSLIGSPADRDLMTMMTGKNDRNFKDLRHTMCFYFSVCFFPSVCVCCLVLFPLNLYGMCRIIHKQSRGCHVLLGFRNSTEYWNGYGQSHMRALSLAQDMNAFFLVLIFVAMSSSYVHRLHLLWRMSPFVNKSWICAIVVSLVLQLVYFSLSRVGWSHRSQTVNGITDVPFPSLIIVPVWPLVALGVAELFKRRYIKERIRYQRRAKLKFGTKLGMNSPF